LQISAHAICQAVFALDKIVKRWVASDESEGAGECREKEVVDILAAYLGEDINLPEEKRDYIVSNFLASADLRRIVSADNIGMVELDELLEIQEDGLLSKKKCAEALEA
jgi:hypothetical protein